MFRKWQLREQKSTVSALVQRPNIVSVALKAKLSALSVERFIKALRQP